MPRPSRWSRDAVLEAAQAQQGLLTAAQLAELGVHRSTLSRSDQLGGMFTRVLPGVHSVIGPGDLTPDRRDMAAQLYAGNGSVLTGVGVLRRRGVRSALSDSLGADGVVHVLVPASRRRLSAAFVTIERTVWVPSHVERGGLRFAPVARLVLDAARRCSDEQAVRALVFEAIQRGLTSPEALDRERRRGQIRGSRFTRLALEEVFAGVRSVPEADLRQGFLGHGVTGLLFNPRLFDEHGRLVAVPDVYDPCGVCLEVDSREHHFQVESWAATMRRHARMTAQGLSVLHAPPSRIREALAEVIEEFVATVQIRRQGPPPALRVISTEYEARDA